MDILRKMFSTKLPAKKEPSILSLLVLEPEKFKLEAWIENDEVAIKIKRKESSNERN